MPPAVAAARRCPARAARRLPTLLLLALVALGVAALPAFAQDAGGGAGTGEDTGKVDVEILPLTGAIDPPVLGALTDTLAAADERDAELLVIQLDTPGALSADGTELLAAVERSTVPVVVYVGPRIAEARAAGLGALLALRADVAAMAPDATLGPLLPVDRSHTPTAAERDLVDRALAGRGGDDGASLAALRERALDADAALERGAVDLVSNGLQSLLVDLDGREVTTAAGTETLRVRRDEASVRLHSLGLVRRTLHATTTPTLVYLLLLFGVGLLLFELFQPGFGVAGIAGVLVLVPGVYGLTVLPVAWWALLLVVGGLGLLAADTAISGLGPPTVLGTAGLTVGSVFFSSSPFLGVPAWVISVMVAAAVVFFVVIMTIVLRAQSGPDVEAVRELVGKRGVVRSMLNPEGHVFIDDALWRSRWVGEDRGKITVGTTVEVTGVDGAVLLVDDPDRGGDAPDGADRSGTDARPASTEREQPTTASDTVGTDR